MVNTRKKFPRGIWSWARQYYTNGPRVAGARSLPAKLDQVISSRNAATAAGRRAPGPGLKPQATKLQAASDKLQAPSCKHQAPSRKLQAP